MPTKIRLQRHGKKKYAYYHVVVADARAPRDGKFIEKLGTYNPNNDPAIVDINFDRALYWVKEGAQPTDTCRALLSYRGIMHKDHLDRGVLKGALTQEQADKKFEAWLKEKETKINSKKDNLSKVSSDAEKARLTAEKEANAKKAAAILAKTSELAAAAEVETTESATEEAPATATEEVVAVETPEVPATEEKEEEATAEESPASEEKTEEPIAEVKEEGPSEEEEKKAE
ncbi:MAG: 30S ribosomal protein S16 [Vicingus serpentipes]|nr:30S ribosomal protein S16 [Vicingus serpentipes]